MLEKRNFYINGSWVAPKKPSDIEVINPASEKELEIIHYTFQLILMC